MLVIKFVVSKYFHDQILLWSGTNTGDRVGVRLTLKLNPPSEISGKNKKINDLTYEFNNF